MEHQLDGWKTKLPAVSKCFCGVKYCDKNIIFLSYSIYLPTAGQDDQFIEILDQLCVDINSNRRENSAIFLGVGSNSSLKSTKRRY